jgi:hypothetical protein
MKKLFLGKNEIRPRRGKVEGQLVVLDGEEFYRITHSDRLRHLEQRRPHRRPPHARLGAVSLLHGRPDP